MQIRSADSHDIPLIRELTMAIWPSAYNHIIGEQQVAYMLDKFYAPEQLRSQMEEGGHRFILCYADERPVGFASYSEIEPQIFKLHKLYVLPGEQGKGIGRFIVSYIVSDIKNSNAIALRLNVNRYNHSAIAFYEKAGFSRLKEEDIDIGGGYFMNDYVLERTV